MYVKKEKKSKVPRYFAPLITCRDYVWPWYSMEVVVT